MTKPNPFRHFKTSPEIICLAVMMYVRFPLSLRNVEDILHERGMDVSHETVRFWCSRFGPMFASEILKKPRQSNKFRKGFNMISLKGCHFANVWHHHYVGPLD
ncbi:hypothetical protein RUA4292_01195 [Ruegeria atlantica]|uniref:Transposase n=1 Tax=Ruegeria atlantica TaxID=81569 RepID=A0A0N7LQ49_9RHOB|nr:hypothetical protein RUA4292_01195 [Ruegeria atlantica]